MHAYFLQHPIAKEHLASNAKGAIMSGLNMGIIKKIPIPVPPLKLQQRFSGIVSSIRQQRDANRAHLAELDTLFASLQSRAFRGEL
jgi:type I restriction enzyme S subunit